MNTHQRASAECCGRARQLPNGGVSRKQSSDGARMVSCRGAQRQGTRLALEVERLEWHAERLNPLAGSVGTANRGGAGHLLCEEGGDESR